MEYAHDVVCLKTLGERVSCILGSQQQRRRRMYDNNDDDRPNGDDDDGEDDVGKALM